MVYDICYMLCTNILHALALLSFQQPTFQEITWHQPMFNTNTNTNTNTNVSTTTSTNTNTIYYILYTIEACFK